jgi:hypothetical protein
MLAPISQRFKRPARRQSPIGRRRRAPGRTIRLATDAAGKKPPGNARCNRTTTVPVTSGRRYIFSWKPESGWAFTLCFPH